MDSMDSMDSMNSMDSTESSVSSKSFELSSALSFINFGSKKNKKNTKQETKKRDNALEDEKKKYIKCMDEIVEQIKNLSWGHTIAIAPDPLYISLNKKKMCYITKLVRFSSYEFRGYGSKKILRYFMN